MVKKANDRYVFDIITTALPVSIERIELLLQILKPAYALNINFQSNRASIGDVIPKIANLIHIWQKSKTKLSIIGQQLCNLLIEEFECMN
jgi:hypothetical protein